MKTTTVSLKNILGFVVVAGLLLQPAVSKADGEESESQQTTQSEDSSKSSEDSQKVVTSVASPVQAKADPFGLPKAGLVQVAGSDAAAAQFMAYLPAIQKEVFKTLPECAYLKNAVAMTLDPTKLTVLTDSTVRVYFVSEGAGYHNTLGVNVLPPGSLVPTAKTPGIVKDDASLLFPDASSPVSTYDPAKIIARTGSEPLLPGDFINFGNVKAGSLLDFFLISNGANGGSSVFTDETARNADHTQHIVALSVPNSPYLLLSFEDMYGGGDRDYNDTIFAVDLRTINLQKLVSAPEPSTWLIMAGFAGILLVQNRRRQNRVA